MADTTFAPGTVIKADWLQDVNDVVYGGGLTGDTVSGPPSSTDGGVAFFDDTTGKVINSSSLLIGNVVSLDQGQTLHNKSMDSGCGWVGNTINPIFGGTGQSTYTPGDILYSNGFNGLTKLPIGAEGEVLTVTSSLPSWESASGAGLGDVSGPASAVSNNITTFDGTSGKLIKDSGIAIPASTIVGTTDTQSITNKTMGSGCVWNGTDVAIADGGTGASTAQTAINNLTAVAAATAGHVLTKVGSDAVWAVGSGGGSAGNLLSVLDYGAIGNGVADDTTAIQNCINACFSTGKNMLVPAGTYLVTSLTMNNDTYANHFSIFGEGRNKTIIRKYSTSSAALLTVGDSTPAIFQANITVEGITFDGLNTTTAAAVRTYDMVRSSFKDCTFMRANVGFAFNGGVANQFYNCMFDACNYGVFMQWVSGMVSQPNETLFNGCQFVNNYFWGLYFTHGALVVLDSCEIEGNGTTGNASTGGIYAGSLETLAPSLINSQGIIAQGCWFEANAGRASCYFTDGRNTVRDCYFIANPNSTYDVYVSGGTYVLENCSFQNTKTNHLYETAGVSAGNYINAITGSVTFNKTIDAAKTKVDYNSGPTGGSTVSTPFYIDQPAVGSNITYYSGYTPAETYPHNAYQNNLRVVRGVTDLNSALLPLTGSSYFHLGQLDANSVAYTAYAGYQSSLTTIPHDRTGSNAYRARVDARTLGDVNGFFATMSMYGTAATQAAASLNFNASPSCTVSGGDVFANANKVNIYGFEYQLYGNPGVTDTSAFGGVLGMFRDNTTITADSNRIWCGLFIQSPSASIDSGIKLSGNMDFGIDLSQQYTGITSLALRAGNTIDLNTTQPTGIFLKPTASTKTISYNSSRDSIEHGAPLSVISAQDYMLKLEAGDSALSELSGTTGGIKVNIDGDLRYIPYAATAAGVTSSDTWGDTTWVNTFHNTNRTVTSDVVADAQIISVAEVGKHGIVAASKSSGNAATGAQSTIGVASFVNNDNTANPQSAYGAYIETVRASGASTTHGLEVGLTNYGTTVDSSPYNASPTGLTEVARLAVNTGINAGTKVSHALSIVSVNESTSYANKFSKGIVFHNMALDGTNGNDGNKATALALARGHSLDWFVYTGAGSGDLGPRLTSNVSVAADAMQVVFENKEVSFNNNVGTQSVAIKNNGIVNLKANTSTVDWTENGDLFVYNSKLYIVLGGVAKEVALV